MRLWLGSIILAGTMATAAFAGDKGPNIQILDNKLSIDAESIPLSRLLRLLDLATGMQSKVPPELANRNISVKFSGLDLDEGVRKVFQGLPLDYIVIAGQGIVVTAASQSITASDSAPVYTPPQPAPMDQPFIQDFNQPGGQPPTIQTPFGPMTNPRAGQPMPPNAPLSVPGQQNPMFPGPPGQQQPQPGMIQTPFGPITNPNPGGAPNTPPFGTPNSFGQPPTPGVPTAPANPLNPSPLFSNPAPLGAPGTPRTP
jgi:hypothetical protein